MSFGQPSGPPATARQIKELLELLQSAGHVDFRDARGPMGFTQRQAAGKFTRDEADAFIEQLQDAQDSGAADSVAVPPPRLERPKAVSARRSPAGGLASIPSEDLAAELQRRGWVVMEP